MADRLMLLDTASLYFRAFYGVPDSLKRADGTSVNAVRGLLDIIARLVTDFEPTHLVACWDDDWRPHWRVELIPSYAGPEPGLPGVDRVEVVLGDEVAGREHDLILSAAANGETFNSQTGAKISFQALPPSEEVRSVKGRRSVQRAESRSPSRPLR